MRVFFVIMIVLSSGVAGCFGTDEFFEENVVFQADLRLLAYRMISLRK